MDLTAATLDRYREVHDFPTQPNQEIYTFETRPQDRFITPEEVKRGLHQPHEDR